jgi:cyclophilin family peptidyl-prolyl cis-trans isomerase
MKLIETFLYTIIIYLSYQLYLKMNNIKNEKFSLLTNNEEKFEDSKEEDELDDESSDELERVEKLEKLKYLIDDTQFELYDELNESENIFIDEDENTTKMSKAYFDISIGGVKKGRVIMVLFDEIVPKTTNNFKELCKNKYHKSLFHRVIKGFMIQGGDFTHKNGTGGYSIYGQKFEDENFNINHDDKGVLSMANSGPNTNGSQFFITTTATPHLNGKHVVFGKVIEGYEIIEEIENLNTNSNDVPDLDVVIEDSGIINN